MSKEHIKAIEEYLVGLNDPSIKEFLIEENLNKCYNYIVSEARKKQENGAAMIKDEVVYGWARHFFDEKMFEDNKWLKKESKAPDKAEKEVEKPKEVKRPIQKVENKLYEEITIFDL